MSYCGYIFITGMELTLRAMIKLVMTSLDSIETTSHHLECFEMEHMTLMWMWDT